MEKDGINLDWLNPNLSRRDALGAMAGAAGLTGMLASLGFGQSRPPRKPVKLPPRKLGQTEGIVRWSQFSPIPLGESYGIHYAGLVASVANVGSPKTVSVVDTYVNPNGPQTVFQSDQNFGQPVGFSGNFIAIPCDDGTLRTIIGGAGYQTGQITLPSRVISNMFPIGNNTLVYVDAVSNLNAIQIVDANTATTVFSGFLGRGPYGNVNVQVLGNTFICVLPPSIPGPVIRRRLSSLKTERGSTMCRVWMSISPWAHFV